MLSLAIVKVVGRIGQHFECSKSSDLLSIESIAIKQTLVPKLWQLALRLSRPDMKIYLTQRKP